jgi:hypothetical protein
MPPRKTTSRTTSSRTSTSISSTSSPTSISSNAYNNYSKSGNSSSDSYDEKGSSPSSRQGTNALIFGILGLVILGLGIIFSIMAIIYGAKSLKESRGKAGFICGIVAVIIFVIAVYNVSQQEF